MDALVQQTESPFTVGVLHFPFPAKFRMPQIEMFDGTKDPIDHLNTYKNQIEPHGYQDPIRCRTFAITLKGPTLVWFNRLSPSSISSFTELSIAFVSHFIRARTYKKPSYHLLTIKQNSQESLRSYVQRFNAESIKVDIPDEKFAITAFIAGLGVQLCDAPKPRGPLTTRQPVEYKWRSGYPTPLQKIGHSLLCTGSSTQKRYLHIPVPNSPIIAI